MNPKNIKKEIVLEMNQKNSTSRKNTSEPKSTPKSLTPRPKHYFEDASLMNEIEKTLDLKNKTKVLLPLKSNCPFNNNNAKLNKYEKALGIFTLSSYLPLKKRLYLNLFHKKLNKLFFATKQVLIQKTIFDHEKMTMFLHSLIKHFLEDENLIHMLNKSQFIPSKTAQNSLNFILNDEEKNLITNQNPDVINLFKLVYLMIDEPFELIEDSKIIENLFISVFKRLKVANLKQFFLNYMIKCLNFKSDKIDCLNDFINKNPKLITPFEFNKINKICSFISIFLKEIYEFTCMKTSEGISLTKIRKTYLKYNELKGKIQKMKCLI